MSTILHQSVRKVSVQAGQAHFGIDLIKGHLYFNRRARSFTIAELHEPQYSENIVEVTNTSQFDSALLYAQRLFGLDREFSLDVLFSLNHRRQYVEEILVPPAHAMMRYHETSIEVAALTSERDTLLRQLEATGSVTDPQSGATVLLEQARGAVHNLPADEALALYVGAAEALNIEIASYRLRLAALQR